MLDIAISEKTFKMDSDFNATDFFGECYGVVIGDGSKPERIVLRAFDVERYYLRDLPLHHSQRELPVVEGSNYADFELFVRPTVDFQGQLLSRGVQLKVLEPQWLADELKQRHEASAKIYDEY